MKDLKNIVDLVDKQKENKNLWDVHETKKALKELHSIIEETIDLKKLRLNFSRGYGDNMIPLKVHNTVYAILDLDKLDSLASPGPEEFKEALYNSIKANGLKDPFSIHYVTGVPMRHRHGCLVKTGNNRILVCKKLGIKKIPCIVTNLSGECHGADCFDEPFIEGQAITTESEVRQYFHTPKVNVVFRNGMIVNAYTPYFLRIQNEYSAPSRNIAEKIMIKKD